MTNKERESDLKFRRNRAEITVIVLTEELRDLQISALKVLCHAVDAYKEYSNIDDPREMIYLTDSMLAISTIIHNIRHFVSVCSTMINERQYDGQDNSKSK